MSSDKSLTPIIMPRTMLTINFWSMLRNQAFLISFLETKGKFAEKKKICLHREWDLTILNVSIIKNSLPTHFNHLIFCFPWMQIHSRQHYSPNFMCKDIGLRQELEPIFKTFWRAQDDMCLHQNEWVLLKTCLSQHRLKMIIINKSKAVLLIHYISELAFNIFRYNWHEKDHLLRQVN